MTTPTPTPDGVGGFASPAAAVHALQSLLSPVEAVAMPLTGASGLILAQDVVADRDSPAVSVSAMDGYAVCLASLAPGVVPVVGTVKIGLPPPHLNPLTAAIRIVTGAAIPAGADTVIKRELVTNETPTSITVTATAIAACKRGQAVRPAGENGKKGTKIAAAGREISAPIAASLAAFGFGTPSVYRPVRIAILTTGDELVEVGQSPTPYQIRDSNGPALAALLGRRPWATISPPIHVPDDPEALFSAAERAMCEHDVVICTGGVSMGEYDFVPAMVARLGARIVFHKIPQRPGRPVLGAVGSKGQLIMGLPGNPQSVMVTGRRMVLPLLAKMAGLSGALRTAPGVHVINADDQVLGMWWHRPVVQMAPGAVSLIDTKGSGDIIAAAASDGFIEQPIGAPLDGTRAHVFYAWAW